MAKRAQPLFGNILLISPPALNGLPVRTDTDSLKQGCRSGSPTPWLPCVAKTASEVRSLRTGMS